jgi:hypothetical protein
VTEPDDRDKNVEGTVFTLKMEARVSYVTLAHFCYQTTRLINPHDSQLRLISSFLSSFLFSVLLLIGHFPLLLLLMCSSSVWYGIHILSSRCV